MRLLRKYSLTKQFYLLSTVLLIVSGSVSYLTATYISNTILNQEIEYVQAHTKKIQQEMLFLSNKMSTIFDFVQYDTNLQYLLKEPYGEVSLLCFREFTKTVQSLAIMNNDIMDITIFNEQFHYSTFYTQETQATFLALNDTESVQCLGLLSATYTAVHKRNYLVFSKNIYEYNEQLQKEELVGSIVISIDPKKTTFFTDESFYSVLIDESNQLYHFNEEQISIWESTIERIVNGEEVKEDYMISNIHIPDIRCNLVNIINRNELNAKISSVKLFMNILVLCIVIFIIGIAFLLLNNIVNPINQLCNFIKNIDRESLDHSREPFLIEGSLEISTVSREFEKMLSEIASLNTQLVETTTKALNAEVERTKAEIAHLRSQINPHFLYNTLETVRGLSIDYGSTEIYDISVAMGKIFRYSISEDIKVTLLEELESIDSYLNIQKIRFQNQFEVIKNISQSTQDILVPKMILQPLIENALFHGIEPKVEPSILYIGSTVIESLILQIVVQDDGVGIEEEKLLDIMEALHQEPTHKYLDHIGLLNVHNRLRLEYSKEYGLSIDSNANYGTKVTITLPIFQ
ncbi:MAG: histidine kinase [Eubacteriales bacterium]